MDKVCSSLIVRVCQNFLFERTTPATAICGRGKSLYLGIMTHPLEVFLYVAEEWGRFLIDRVGVSPF